ncbi:MAG: SpoIID/LytB domain-containing protein [Archangiaceae bacterium]|nr:SpoIID/LytB domain-containing protein [Archangiaceae bacterium]
MPLLYALLVLTAQPAPLKVRILERSKPYQATLEAAAPTCDGKPLKSPSVELTLKDRRIDASGTLCDTVGADGRFKVTVDKKARAYPGKLTVVAEGAFLRFVTEVDVEDYLPSVISIEAEGFPPVGLEVQAVVSRTFALASRSRHKDDGFDVCDLAHCQIYRGLEDVQPTADEAVKRTRGEVLLLGGIGLKPAFFHSACGGHTSRAGDVFGEGAEGVGPGISDAAKDGPACKDTPDFKWSFEVERGEMAKGLGLSPEGSAFEPLRRDAAGRVLELKAFNRRYRGNEFMSVMGRAFGWQSLRSMKVTAEEVDNLIRFSGVGLGHGVGLCQMGARAMALKGASRSRFSRSTSPTARCGCPESGSGERFAPNL